MVVLDERISYNVLDERKFPHSPAALCSPTHSLAFVGFRLFLLIFNKRSKLGRFVHLCAVVVAVASNNANRKRVWCGTWPGLMMMGAPNIESMYHIVLLFILEHTSGWSVNFLLFINEGQLTVMMMDLFTQSSDRIRNGPHPYIDS